MQLASWLIRQKDSFYAFEQRWFNIVIFDVWLVALIDLIESNYLLSNQESISEIIL